MIAMNQKLPADDTWLSAIAILVGLYGLGTYASAKNIPHAYILVPIMQGMFLSSIFLFYFNSEFAKLVILASILFAIPAIAYMSYQIHTYSETDKKFKEFDI